MLLFIFSIFRRRLRYYEKEVGYKTYESCKKLTEKDRFEITEEVKSPALGAFSHSDSVAVSAFCVQPKPSFGSQAKKLQFTTRVASYACLQEMQNL